MSEQNQMITFDEVTPECGIWKPNPPTSRTGGEWRITNVTSLGRLSLLVHWQWMDSPDERARQRLLHQATDELIDVLRRILPTSTGGCLYTFQIAERLTSELKALTEGQQINLRDLLSGRYDLVVSLRTALAQEEARSSKAEREVQRLEATLRRVAVERDEARAERDLWRSSELRGGS
jgi:hypothetical protein